MSNNIIWQKFIEILHDSSGFIWDNINKISIWIFGYYLLPTYEMIGVTIFFVIVELITSYKKMKFLGEWKNKTIKKKRLQETWHKLLLYTIGIITTYVLQKHIARDMVQVMFVFVGIISSREVKIIIDNIETVTGATIWTHFKDSMSNLLGKITNSANKEKEKEKEKE